MNPLLTFFAWATMFVLTATSVPVALHTSDGMAVAPVAQGNVYVSRDHGISWTRKDAGLPEDDGINALLLQGSRVMAGTGSHGVWVMDGNGWSSQSMGLPPSARVLSLAANDRFVFAGLHKHGLYYTTGESNTWHSVGRYYDMNVRALGKLAGRVYVGTDDGIYLLNMTDLSLTMIQDDVQVNGFASGSSHLYAATNKGVLESRDGKTWTTLFDRGAIQKIAMTGSELRLMDFFGHVYRSPEANPYFISEDLLLPHIHFRLTPASPRIMGGEWSDLSFIRGGTRLGLPDNVPLSILLQTPFGLMATRPPFNGGC